MTFPILQTKRLQLVEITAQHAENLYAIFSNEDVTRFYGMSPFIEQSQVENMITSFAKRYKENTSIRWGILWEDHFVGTIGLNQLQLASKRAEVGYELHPNFWGKGIVREAIEAVLAYAFIELGLYRIGAVTFLENTASSNVLMKAGFQKEGVLRGYMYQNEISHDVFVFSIIRPDYVR